MMFGTYNHTAFLRYIVYLNVLSGLCFIQVGMLEVVPRKVCIDNATPASRVNITCDLSTDRIEVLSIFYDHCQTFSGTCTALKNTCGFCHKIFTEGQKLREMSLYRCSHNLQSCQEPVNNLQDVFDTSLQDVFDTSLTNCSSITPNFVLMEYNCVPDTDFIDLCGDKYMGSISTMKHLAYFRKDNDNPFQNCTCSIEGHHTLMVVQAGIPEASKKSCLSDNLSLNWKHLNNSAGDENVTAGQELINRDYKQLQSSRIRLLSNCNRPTPPVWFKIKPDQSVQIQCRKFMENTPSTSSTRGTTRSKNSNPTTTSPRTISAMAGDSNSTVTLIRSTIHSEETSSTHTDEKSTTSMTTNAHNTFPETSPGERNTKVPLIVGSVIGGLFLIVVTAVIGFLLLRCRRRKQSRDGLGSFSGDVELTNTYDELFGQTHQPHASNGFQDSEPDYTQLTWRS